MRTGSNWRCQSGTGAASRRSASTPRAARCRAARRRVGQLAFAAVDQPARLFPLGVAAGHVAVAVQAAGAGAGAGVDPVPELGDGVDAARCPPARRCARRSGWSGWSRQGRCAFVHGLTMIGPAVDVRAMELVCNHEHPNSEVVHEPVVRRDWPRCIRLAVRRQQRLASRTRPSNRLTSHCGTATYATGATS